MPGKCKNMHLHRAIRILPIQGPLGCNRCPGLTRLCPERPPRISIFCPKRAGNKRFVSGFTVNSTPGSSDCKDSCGVSAYSDVELAGLVHTDHSKVQESAGNSGVLYNSGAWNILFVDAKHEKRRRFLSIVEPMSRSRCVFFTKSMRNPHGN